MPQMSSRGDANPDVATDTWAAAEPTSVTDAGDTALYDFGTPLVGVTGSTPRAAPAALRISEISPEKSRSSVDILLQRIYFCYTC